MGRELTFVAEEKQSIHRKTSFAESSKEEFAALFKQNENNKPW